MLIYIDIFKKHVEAQYTAPYKIGNVFSTGLKFVGKFACILHNSSSVTYVYVHLVAWLAALVI